MCFKLGIQTLVLAVQPNIQIPMYWFDCILLTLFHRWNNLRVSDLGLMAMSVCLVKVAGSKKGASSGLYFLSSLARHLRTTSLLTFGGILITPTLWPRNRVCKRVANSQTWFFTIGIMHKWCPIFWGNFWPPPPPPLNPIFTFYNPISLGHFRPPLPPKIRHHLCTHPY